MTDREPLPVKGYSPQSNEKIALVNEFKADEERLLRKLEALVHTYKDEEQLWPNGSRVPRMVARVKAYDEHWLDVAWTHFNEGFMALNRAVFQPQRIKLPEDE